MALASDSNRPGTTAGDRRRHVLCFPLPYQGHINPMFQLAGLLHSRGFAITIFHTDFNAPDASRHPAYDFIPVPDGLLEHGRGNPRAPVNLAKRILDLNRACEAPFRERLAALLEQKHAREDVACLVADAHLLTLLDVARELGVPTMVLRTASAACFRCFLAYPMLHEKGYLPPQESKLHMPVEELPPLRVKDIYHARRVDNEIVRELLARATEAVKRSSCLVLNTSDALEATELKRIRDELNIPLVVDVGPLHKLSTNDATGSSLLNQDYGCIEWLGTKPPESVLFVSFGSLASVDSKKLLEVAWGLENSGIPFLWVVRPDLVHTLEDPNFLNSFKVAVEDRGRLVQWAPQQEVLAHRAVGGFWTHCGWNSTLESICEGVPMICTPQFADQMMNARYIEKAWGVGFELEGELEREKIEMAIRKLMKQRDGEVMRERAKELQNKVSDCLKTGGTSWCAIDKLVTYINSM